MAVYHIRGKALVDVEAHVEAPNKVEAIRMVRENAVVQLTSSVSMNLHGKPVFRPEHGGVAVLASPMGKLWITQGKDKEPHLY
jgi:hypothetical protein